MNDVQRQVSHDPLDRINKLTWKNSVQSILDTAEALNEAKDSLGRHEFMTQIYKRLLLSESTVHKIMLIARNKVLANPANFSRLPNVWAKLTILSHVDEDKLQNMIDDGVVHPGISRTATEQLQPVRRPLDSPRKKTVVGKNDSRRQLVKIPPGGDLLKLCEWGMALETGGMNIRDIAAKIGLNVASYAEARDIIVLSRRDDITTEDAALVKAAMDDFKAGNYPVKYWYRQIKPIVQKIWGAGARHRVTVRTNKYGQKFLRAVTIIQGTCEAAAMIGELHLGGKEAYVNALKQVQSAQSDLRTMVKILTTEIERFKEKPNG